MTVPLLPCPQVRYFQAWTEDLESADALEDLDASDGEDGEWGELSSYTPTPGTSSTPTNTHNVSMSIPPRFGGEFQPPVGSSA